MLAELQGYELLAKGEIGPAFDAVRQGHDDAARVAGPRPPDGAELRLRRERGPQGRRAEREPGSSAGRPGRDPPRRRQGHRTRSRPIAGWSRWRSGPTATCRSSAGSSRSSPGGRPTRAWSEPPPEPAAGTEEATIDRIDLNTLGPLVWSPFPARAVLGHRHQRARSGPLPTEAQGQECPGALLPGRQVRPLHAAA